MNRREFMGMAALLPWLGALPAEVLAVPARPQQRIVVLVKLAGGNDGLNTLIPHTDPLYYQYRPSIGVPKHQVLDIGESHGLNPYLKALKPWWDNGNMAWVQGVGYPHGTLSHFRSSDIWETAVDASQYTDTGWLGALLPECKPGLHGIAIGENSGPMSGKNCNTIAMQSPQSFLSQISLLEDIQPVATNSVLAHVTNVHHQLYAAGEQLSNKLQRPVTLGIPFSTSKLGRDLEAVAKMILTGVDAAVYMVTLDGFDTHSNQNAVQSNLLHQLAGALDSFAQAMQRGGRWNDVMLMTYSEFGRRVQENHGKGTDHGTAGVQLVMGGKVRGGLYGEPLDLSHLDGDGNPQHTVDFRSVYGTVAQRWLGQPNPWGQFGTLPFV
ncbi:MAG: DUF1501 domain-containing protein [Candidatus Thiothrix putei]|uniref:DUF1501 domain-containing protein n=1 Tax=Candidatus Thiothrix putei TaxID=3080811 RepID=A0AA95KHG8_9GAMM|nr:MAG: DUF1501 domain-containing protein [Candidatus Thiothrix putei]